MDSNRSQPVLRTTGVVLMLVGLAVGFGGVWLISLGGSWYYVVAALCFLLTGALVFAGKPAALWVYALLVLGTLGWALWEIGLDWWALAPRGDVVFLIGAFLLLPFITRRLTRRGDRPPSAFRGGGLALTLSLVAALGVAAAAWFNDPHDLSGALPGPRADVPDDYAGVPAGGWHAYGRSSYGGRWSPLTQITPQNVDRLQVAWTYHTGDIRGPDDPVETTYEVTPLKIDDTVYLCTPHHYVIALDAETGRERWRFDPVLQGELALQHLTCRGVSYYAAPDAPAGAGCARRLYLPTVDAA